MKLHRLVTFALPAMPSLVRCPLACLFFLAVIAGPFSDTAGAAAYTFTNIADTDGIFAPTTQFVSGLGTAPLSISNTGTVAFSSLLKAGGNGVFAGNGGPVQSIALSSDPVFLGVGGASINSAGTVAFRGIFDAGGEGVFTGSGGPVTAIALSSEATFSSFGNPVISDAGTVGFQVNLVGGSRSILTRTGGSTTTIAAESGPIFRNVAGNLSMNSTGTVAFLGGLKNGQGGFFTGGGGPPTTVALGNFSDIGVSAINDTGSVTFIPGSHDAVYVRDSSGLWIIADTTGPFAGFGNFSSINNSGKLAFLAGLDNGTGGIFTGPDPVADTVILLGSSLFGSTVTRFGVVPAVVGELFGNTDLNDVGQVAFHYELANGRQGIAVATPTPEPGIAVSLALGILLLGAMRRRSFAG